mmetsp:Transcript_13289/g.26001  ORF Transcript_13289/g.26001 Transcript_13289/m.26001 type:complete len:310 (-) Transcript_13289:128-1057(-)
MQHDEVIWQVINQGFCSYKVRTKLQGKDTQNFCRNKYNVTGLCNRQSCPLANSRYSTVIEKEGWCYLMIKTIERAHTPKNLWERIKLPKNYAQALALIDKHLEYFPKTLIHRNKQRLTKIHQYLIRMRKLQLKVQPKIVGEAKKITRREKRREQKAEKIALIDRAIKAELVQRLKSGLYDGIVNFPNQVYKDALADVGGEEQREDETEAAEGDEKASTTAQGGGEEGEDEDEEGVGEVEYVEAYDDDFEAFEDDVEGLGEMLRARPRGEDDDDEDGNEDESSSSKRPKKRRKRKKAREIEYEVEREITR